MCNKSGDGFPFGGAGDWGGGGAQESLLGADLFFFNEVNFT